MSSINGLTLFQTIIITLLAFNQQLVYSSEVVNNGNELSSKSNNTSDELFSEIIATNVDSGEVSSQESTINNNSNNDKWSSAEFLPISGEDFPVAFYASSSKSDNNNNNNNNEPSSHENLSTIEPLMPSESSSILSSSSFTPLIASASSSAEAEDVLRRMGWTTDGEDSRESGNNNNNIKRFSGDSVKSWSKALPSSSSSSASSSSASSVSSPITSNVGHHQELLRSGSSPNSVIANDHVKEESNSNNNNNNQAIKNQHGFNVEDLSASATSNNYDVPSSSSSSAQYTYSSSGASNPTGNGNSGRTRYGYRVNSRTRDPEYSSSNNYDEFANPDYPSAAANDAGYSEGPYESNPSSLADDYRNDMKSHSNSPSSSSSSSSSGGHSSSSDYEREIRPIKYNSYPSRPRLRARNQYMSAATWPEYELETSPGDRSWLSSIFGGYSRGYRPRYRGPYNLASTESLPLSSLPLSFFDAESYNLIRPPPLSLHHHPHPARAATGWANFATFAAPRPHATNLRPAYSTSFPFTYSHQPPPPPPPPRSALLPPPAYAYATSPGAYGSASSMLPLNVRPYSFATPLNGLNAMIASPSVSYPIKIPFSPFPVFSRAPVYPMMRPFMANDLIFAESLKKMNFTGNVDKMDASSSQNALSFVQPPPHLPPTPTGGQANYVSHPLVNRQGSEQMFNFFNPNQWTNSVTKIPEGESSTANPQDRTKSSNVVGRLFGRWLS